ncbi:MAG: tetratricopeptide repeat protein [Pseudomonadota bacterium]
MEKIFISRTGADSDAAVWMANTLETAGYSCVIQDRDFRIGESFPRNMREAFEQCDTTIAVMSPDYWKSPFCRDEWDAAYALDRNGVGKLIPVLLNACLVPKLASKLAYLDLTRLGEGDRGSALTGAVDAVISGRATLRDIMEPNTQPLTKGSFYTQNFTGRTGELSSVHAALWGKEGAAALTPIAVTGFGGVGKSAIAKQYAYMHLHRYSGVWLVRGETSETLIEDFAALAETLDPRLEDVPDKSKVAAVGAELARRYANQDKRPFLFILDNIETPRDIPEWLNPTDKVEASEGLIHRLVTSRYNRWPTDVHPVEITELPREASRRLLLQSSGRHGGDGLEDLLDALGDLPLALVQAGAYLRENESESFTHYKDGLLKRIGQASDDWPADQKLVAATYLASIERAEARAPGAEAMLLRTAFVAADDIPLSILSDYPQAEAARKARDALARYSLVKAGADSPAGPSVSVHRLLQVVLKADFDKATWIEGCDGAAQSIRGKLEGHAQDVRSWPGLTPFLSHVIALGSVTPKGSGQQALAACFNEVGLMLKSQARHDEAEPLYRRALAIDEASYGPDHPSVAIRLNNLAGLRLATNRLDEAEPLYRRALAIDEASLGPDHPIVAIRLGNLAGLLQDTNRLDEAEPLRRRELSIMEENLPEGHPHIATASNNLAGLLEATNRLDEAEPLYRRALSIDEESYGLDHPNVAIRLGNLAGLLGKTNRLEESEPLRRRELSIMEENLPEGHPHIATASNNLAVLLKATNRLDEAEPLMRRALSIDEESYGPDHPKVAIRLNNLADTYANTGRLAEALPMIQRADEIFSASLPDHHPSVQNAKQGRAMYEMMVAAGMSGMADLEAAIAQAKAEGVLDDQGNLAESKPSQAEVPPVPRKKGLLSRLFGRKE